MPLLRVPSSRWSAAALHAVVSLFAIGGVAIAAVLMWFPAGLWHAAGLQELFGIMLAADIVLGPLLTLLVFRRGKPSLKFDMSAIVLVQAAFLAYGVYTLWLNRPVFLVGSEHSFALVFASEVPDGASRDAAARRWPRFHGRGPWIVGVDLSSPVAREEAAFAFAMGGGGPLRDPTLYVAYEDIAVAVLRKSQPVPARIETARREGALRAAALVSIRTDPVVILLDAVSGEPRRIVR